MENLGVAIPFCHLCMIITHLVPLLYHFHLVIEYSWYVTH